MQFSEVGYSLLQSLVRQASGLLDAFYLQIPNIILAVLLVFLFSAVGKQSEKWFVQKMAPRHGHKAGLVIVGSLSRLGLVVLGVLFALGVLQLDKVLASALASLGILGITLGFAMKETTKNLISGIVLIFQQPLKVGDIVELDGLMGEVVSVGLRVTEILSFNGTEYIIPNSQVASSALLNYSAVERRRLEFKVLVGLGQDLPVVQSIISSCLEELEGRIASHPVQVLGQEFGEYAIEFNCYVWIYYPANNNYLRMRHEAIITIKEQLEKNGIRLPLPIATLDFSAGAMLPQSFPDNNQ